MRIVLLADIHIGSIKNTEYVYNIISDLINNEFALHKTDALIILGDYFDRLFKVNEDYTLLAMNVMTHITNMCIQHNVKLRIIYGTESHEMGQYDKLFSHHFSDLHLDVKLIDTVCEEELFPNIKVLYLPEEYLFDKHEFYQEYLYSGKTYNYIFGHGIIEEGMPVAAAMSVNKDSKEKHVARFKAQELADISNITAFGHYHVHSDLGNNVYYVGSLFRKSFGEEEAKGYGVIEDNKFIFVENKYAYVYKTYKLGKDDGIFKSTENMLKAITDIKNNHQDLFDDLQFGRIRIVLELPEDVDTTFKDIIRDMIAKDSHFSLLIKEPDSFGIADDIGRVNSEPDPEWAFVLDKSLPVEDKLRQYALKRWNRDIPIKRIKEYIYGK